VLPILGSAAAAYPFVQELAELYDAMKYYSILPNANAFQQNLDIIILHISRIHPSIVYYQQNAAKLKKFV
jgi:hypothetical protein